MTEENYLNISGISTFAYCRRRWALENIEGLWHDNYLTVEGSLQHEKAHDYTLKESRGNKFITRALRVVSHKLQIVGECDIVEFVKSKDGIFIESKKDYYNLIPVEYKHGNESIEYQYELQLCAQALCLEEMLNCHIEYGFIFYKKSKQKEKIEFTEELRKKVILIITEMNNLYNSKHVPVVKKSKRCSNCAQAESCVPKVLDKTDVHTYILSVLGGDDK